MFSWISFWLNIDGEPAIRITHGIHYGMSDTTSFELSLVFNDKAREFVITRGVEW